MCVKSCWERESEGFLLEPWYKFYILFLLFDLFLKLKLDSSSSTTRSFTFSISLSLYVSSRSYIYTIVILTQSKQFKSTSTQQSNRTNTRLSPTTNLYSLFSSSFSLYTFQIQISGILFSFSFFACIVFGFFFLIGYRNSLLCNLNLKIYKRSF